MFSVISIPFLLKIQSLDIAAVFNQSSCLIKMEEFLPKKEKITYLTRIDLINGELAYFTCTNVKG